MIGYIYKYENKVNHKIYIGQTTDLIGRKSAHKYKATFIKSKFYNAVRKYGWEAFNFEVLDQVEGSSMEEITELLDSLEIKYIQEFDSFNKGYNSTSGGHSYRGKTVSPEFIEYCKHRTYSEETRKRMSESAKKRIVTEGYREYLKQINRDRLKEEQRVYEEEGILTGTKKALAKVVLQIDVHGNVVNQFRMVTEAAKYIHEHLAPNVTIAGIKSALYRHYSNKTESKYYYGFNWELKSIV